MNREEIRNVLLELAGEGLLLGRGVGADDILLTRLGELTGESRSLFWRDFGEVLQEVWAQGDVGAISNAAVFISRIPQSERPSAMEAEHVASFLLEDAKVKNTAWSSLDELRQIVAGLRMLSALRLGGRVWWQVIFYSWYFWLNQPKTRQEREALYAWQAMLHASRGCLNSKVVAPNFDAWFYTAQAVQDFPSLEVFTFLADQMESQTADKDALKEEVLEAYQSLHARCYHISSCPQGIENLKAVIESWLEDRVGMKPQEADLQLKWHQPDLTTPSERLNKPAERTSYSFAA